MASTSSAATVNPRWRRAAPAAVTQRILGVAAAALGIDAYVRRRRSGITASAPPTPDAGRSTRGTASRVGRLQPAGCLGGCWP